MKKYTLGILVALLPLQGLAAPVFIGGESISLTESASGDIYIGGATIDIGQPIDGDASVAGSSVNINSKIGQDLVGFAGNFYVNGLVGDDVRIFAGNVTLNQPVAGDVIIFGGTVSISQTATIGGDLIVGAGMVTVNSNIGGNVRIYGSNTTLNGSIAGNAILDYETLTLGSGVTIGGTLDYSAPTANPGLEAITQGEKNFHKEMNISSTKSEGISEGMLAIVTGFVVYSWIWTLLISLMLIFIWRQVFANIAQTLREQPGKSLLMGTLFYLLMPIAIILFLITIIGIPLAIILMLLFAIVLILGSVIGTSVFSAWIIEKWWGGLEYAAWWKIVLIVTIISFLFAVITGVDMIAVAFALGAIMLYKTTMMKKMINEIDYPRNKK